MKSQSGMVLWSENRDEVGNKLAKLYAREETSRKLIKELEEIGEI